MSRPAVRLGSSAEARAWRERGPFLTTGSTSLQVQSVLYLNSFAAIDRSLASLARSAELAGPDRVSVSVRYGDCSPIRCLEPDQVDVLVERYARDLQISYEWFGDNLGSARGHNRLAAGSAADFLLTLNPDVVIAPRTLELLLEPFRRSAVGMTEAKQLPIEHPKEYDRTTGSTSWAATACAVFPRALFESVDGFDAESFFMYCDDVDFSWKVRRAGLMVVHQPAAVVFHDKRVGLGGVWEPTEAERYYSAEAALMLFQKWSRPDLVERTLVDFDNAPDAVYQRAAAEFRRRRDAATLPTPVDDEHEIGIFEQGNYAAHRYVL
ncbi:hypothetical protein [Cellulomonas biazotea]|uniref:Glycosyl transferase n=1 Tax=Cellulomonas biazotea TaxID=1709 RepID=A0A402DQ67_9CELL|nr:hypothetical protein [Cellulomonas biazotea]GCE76279.1 glycosyl transferase [Cellulomonas biazotea]